MTDDHSDIRDNADSEKKPIENVVLPVTIVTPVTGNNSNNSNTVTLNKIIKYYDNKENKLKIASSLYPNKRLTFSAISENTKLSSDVIKTTVYRHTEDFFEKDSIKGRSIISLKPQAKLMLENQYFEYEKQQKETEQYLKRQEQQQSKTNMLYKEIEKFVKDSEHLQLQLAENKPFIKINVRDLMEYSSDLAQELLDNSEDVIGLFSIVFEKESGEKKQLGFHELPDSAFIHLNNLRTQHCNKLFTTRGLIKSRSAIRNKLKEATFECPNCGHTVTLPQTGEKLISPQRCTCGRRGKFHVVDKKSTDVQILELETLTEDLSFNEQPVTHTLLLEGSLLAPDQIKLLSHGSRIIISGLLKVNDNGKDVISNFIIEVSSFNMVDEESNLLNPSEDELENFQAISKNNPISYFKNKIFHRIYGHELAKNLLILQQFSGYRTTERKALHILLVGDPGTSKTELLDIMQLFSPRSKRSSGGSSTAVGLTANVRKNEIIGDFVAESGVLPQCHRGSAFIDELDKMTDEDRNKLHDALESQFVVVDKANIHARFPCDVKVCATANPEHGKFDLDYSEIREQLQKTFPVTILDRFDFIIPFRDRVDSKQDESIALKILDRDGRQPALEPNFFKKYVMKANLFNPKIPKELRYTIAQFYRNIRENQTTTDKHQHVKSFSPRSLQAIIRLSEAFARSRLSSEVSRADVQSAIQIYKQIHGISIL